MYLVEQTRDDCRQTLLWLKRLPFPAGFVAPRQDDAALGHILGADFDTQRHAAHLPIVELEAGAGSFAFIGAHANAGGGQRVARFAGGVEDLGLFLVRFIDGDDHDLRWAQAAAAGSVPDRRHGP